MILVDKLFTSLLLGVFITRIFNLDEIELDLSSKFWHTNYWVYAVLYYTKISTTFLIVVIDLLFDDLNEDLIGKNCLKTNRLYFVLVDTYWY